MGQKKYFALIFEIFDNKHPSFRLNYVCKCKWKI